MQMNPPQPRTYPALAKLCDAFPRQVEIAVDTGSGEMLMELRVRDQQTVLAREPMESISDVGRAATAILTT